MHGRPLFNGLDFDNDQLRYYEIHSVSAVKADALVLNRQLDLTSESYPAEIQFPAHALLIRVFQKAGAETAVHFDGSADDLMCQVSARTCVVLLEFGALA